MRIKKIETKIQSFGDLILHIRTRFLIGVVLLFICLPVLFWLAVVSAHATDYTILQFVTNFRTDNLNIIARFITSLGGYWLILAFLVLLGYLWKNKKWLEIGFFIIGGLNAFLLNTVLKLAYHRNRPVIFESLINEQSFSYPSGHAFAATVFWGFLAFVLFNAIKNKFVKFVLVAGCALIIVLVGISRIYLGVHWPSDVLAGWLLGAWWLYFVLGFIREFDKWKN